MKLPVRVRVRSEVAPVSRVEILVNGVVWKTRDVPGDRGRGEWFEVEEIVPVSQSSWIAARAASSGPTAKADAEAHTNPVYVELHGKAPYAVQDLDWLLAKVDGQIAQTQRRQFDEQLRVLDYYQRARRQLLEIREAGGLSAEFFAKPRTP
jgi:hypothetical protein